MAKGAPAKGTLTKEERKAAKAARKAASRAQWSQMWQAFQMQRREDKALLPIMLAVALGALAVFLLLAFLFDSGAFGWTIYSITGLILGVLLAFVVFTRRVTRSVYTKAEGQPGAAAWALDQLRGQWRITQAVAANTHMDTVHRVVGRPGVIFVGEGAPHRVRGLLTQEKKRTARVVGDTPIYEIVIGNDEGEVPLKDLHKFLRKLPTNIDVKRMDSLEGRLSALGGRSQAGAQLPKGPLPGGAKVRGMQRAARRRGGR